MARWSKLEDNSCINQYNETIKSKELKMQSYFIELVSGFLRDCYGDYCFRPIPPRLGNGKCVDLLKFYLVVKQKGGFEAISENNWWGEVGLQCGSISSFGSAFKLIYDQYLSSFETWLVKLEEEKTLDQLEKDYGAYVSEIGDMKRGSDYSCVFNLEKSGSSFIDLTDVDDEDESKGFDTEKLEKEFAVYEGSNEGNDNCVKSTKCKVNIMVDSNSCIVEENHGLENTKQVKSEISSENSVASKKCSTENEEMIAMDTGVSKEISSHKRKRDCFSEMLQWMANVAKDPTKPMIGKTLKCSRRALYGNKALLARESLFLKKIRRHCVDQSRRHSAGQFGCQKKQKRHPSLFIHSQKMLMSSCYPTEVNPMPPRQRLEARIDIRQTSSTSTTHLRPLSRQRISLRIADVPKWTGLTIESDPKWLGTRTWPLEKAKNKQPIERDPIGKGRIVDCGCQFRASIECVKFHVSERRKKIMFELRSAYYAWSFDKMGEDCSVSWTFEEEKKFGRVIKETPRPAQKFFWEPLCRAIPQKRWNDQVKYYYNVFMLRRRAYQNRHYPSEIDSDDDETEYRSTNNSIRHGKFSETV
ncbi:hypothetical protein KSS87_009189 [Heliosperma pusillum]|nr:hypothetical protein KSS87_009189 [Heliosperma pusillum]